MKAIGNRSTSSQQCPLTHLTRSCCHACYLPSPREDVTFRHLLRSSDSERICYSVVCYWAFPRLVSQRDLVNSSRRCTSRTFLNTDLSALDRVWSQKWTSDRCKRVSVTPPLKMVMGWAVRRRADRKAVMNRTFWGVVKRRTHACADILSGFVFLISTKPSYRTACNHLHHFPVPMPCCDRPTFPWQT